MRETTDNLPQTKRALLLPARFVDVRDPADARLLLTQSLCLARLAEPTPAALGQVLQWALEIAAAETPLPPLGLLADLGQVLLAPTEMRQTRPLPPGVPRGLLSAYDDHVLGKLLCDAALERAGDALRRYQGREQLLGLTFLAQQLQQRLGVAGLRCHPQLLKALFKEPPARLLAEGGESLASSGLLPLLQRACAEWTAGVQRCPELLGSEDIFELEERTALAPLGERLALRQVLAAAESLRQQLPPYRPRPSGQRREAPTRVLEEDTYPVGGFSSLATRGSIESLLHSQLAYMETDERPDLFDIKYLRDELLYYARDENTFLRRRRLFLFVLPSSLTTLRFKDAALPWQRIILVLGLLLVLVRQLTEWLSSDALTFEIVFLEEEREPLAAEKLLLRTLLREPLSVGTVKLLSLRDLEQTAARCALHSRRALTQVLLVGGEECAMADADVVRLEVSEAAPRLRTPEGREEEPPEDAWQAWSACLEALLRRWV